MAQLTPQDNFRLGFLLRCAEEGCSPAEIESRVKLAFVVRDLEKKAFVGDVLRAGERLLKATGRLGAAYAMLPFRTAAIGIGGAGLLGTGLGYGAAKLQQKDIDPEEAKRQELIAAYKMQADRARRRAKQRGYRPSTPKAPQLFTGE